MTGPGGGGTYACPALPARSDVFSVLARAALGFRGAGVKASEEISGRRAGQVLRSA